MHHWHNPCACGSGLPRFELADAAGIFCTYVCDRCEDEKRSHYNQAIFDGSAPYATSGAEEDLWIDRDYDYE